MRVALDATPLTVSTGGVGRYTAELSLALASEFPGDDYLLLSDQRFDPPDGIPGNLRVSTPAPSAWRRRWWSLGLPATLSRAKTEIFHGTDFSVPYAPVCPTVMTLHDLSPWKDPNWHIGADRVRSRAPALLRLGLATMIITPSEAVRREAIERFRIPPGRVRHTPLAASDWFRPVSSAPPARPYFLYVGVLEPRKNLPLLIEAWAEVARDRSVDLVLAGRRREDFDEPPQRPGLRLLGEVAEDELPALYSGAVATVYPSFYEGFGLPVLEAMQCGSPVIVSRDPALAEVTGSAGLRLDARDVPAWASAMRALLDRPGWRQELAAQSLARSTEYSWARTARETRAVYLETRERFGA